MEGVDDFDIKLERDDVQNEIIVETVDMRQNYLHISNFNLPKQDLENNQTIRTIKTEILDDTYLFNVYIESEVECPDVEALSDHDYERGKKLPTLKWNNQILPETKKRAKKPQNKNIQLNHNIEMLNQDGSSDISYNCEICKKPFKLAYLLKSHMRNHFIKKKFNCNVCHKTFAFSNHLRNHYSIHTGEKNFSCPTCSKTFRQEGHLLNHIRTHTGVKKFSCPLCNKRFTQNVHMKSHLKTHTGEKNYMCQICQKQFTQSGHLQMHMTVHTGERKYECTQCGLKFKQSGHLNNHRKTHKIEEAK